MATISFKSVGQTRKKTEETYIAQTPIPVGIKTPLRLSTESGMFEMNYTIEDQIADNLRNLILTNWGERVGQYNFGANLKPLTTEFVSQENFDNEAIVRINDAVTRWLPYVQLIDYSSEADRLENISTGIIRVTVSYSVPAANVFEKKIQAVLYVL